MEYKKEVSLDLEKHFYFCVIFLRNLVREATS